MAYLRKVSLLTVLNIVIKRNNKTATHFNRTVIMFRTGNVKNNISQNDDKTLWSTIIIIILYYRTTRLDNSIYISMLSYRNGFVV